MSIELVLARSMPNSTSAWLLACSVEIVVIRKEQRNNVEY